MKQFTISNQLTAMPKRLAMVLTMLLIVGIGQVWGAEVFKETFKNSTGTAGFSDNAGNGAFVADNTGWTTQNPYGAGGAAKFGASKKIGEAETPSINCGIGVTSATLTFKSGAWSGDAKTLKLSYTNCSGAATVTLKDAQWSEYTVELTNITGNIKIKFTGNATSSARFFLDDVVVSTTDAPTTYTVTYNANGGSGTMSNSTGSSIKIKECIFTAPECKQFTSWNTADNGSGTSYAPNTTVTENLTLYAQWGDLPSYTVKLMDNNEVLTSSCNTPITLPSREGCAGYRFVGWTNTWKAAQATWTTTAPTIIPIGSYTPTANESLYPVYTKTEGGGTAYEKATTLTEGVYVMVSEKTSGTYKYMPNTTSSGSNPTLGSGITMNNGKTSLTNNITEAMLWDLTATGTANQYYLRPHGSTTIGLGCTASTGANIRISTSYKDVKWTITTSSDYGWQFKSNASTAMYLAVYNDENWRNYTSSITNQNGKFYLFKQISSFTTSYISVPDCCTKLAEVTNLEFSNITSNSITVSVPTTYSDKENVSGYTFNCYSASTGGTLIATADESGTSHTFTGLTKNTTYYFTVIAKGEGNYCNSAETSSRESNNTLDQYTVTLNPNGGSGTFTGWIASASNYTKTVDADTKIDLPELTKTGYDFAGWYDGELVNSPYTVTKTVTLTAQWTAKTYNIIYKDQGNNADFTGANEADLPATHTYGQQTNLVDATKSGYNFLGWFTTSDCSGSAVDHLGATEYTGNITLYAKWEEIPTTCTITYDANGGTGTAPTDNTEYTNGATVTVVGNYGKLTKDGYAFTGWNTAADGSGDSYKAGKTFNITTNTTLYAQWCPAHWVLVTNTSEIEDDTRIIIAAKDYNVALSTTQNTNNRGQATITKKYNTVILAEDVQKLSLEVGISENTFALNTGLGYLYAASSSANHLKTRENYGKEGSWEISFDGVVARVAALGNTHNTLSYNKTSELFSCYEYNKTQKDVVIYKEVCKQDSYKVKENLSNATVANTNAETVLASATSLSLKYSAADGYLLPETITVRMGGVALSSTDDYTWNKETGELTITVTGFYGDIDVKIVSEEDPCYGFAMSTVTATSTINSITLTWTEVAEATGYKVRLDEGEFTTATGLTHTFEGLSPKTTYIWEVQAINGDCQASKTGSTDTKKETFTVSWSVNGTVTSTESVVDGEPIKTTPSDPDDETLEDCGANKFMGWSEKSAGSTPLDAAYYDDLCSAAQMKSKHSSVTGDKTFHAVFATATTTPGTSTTTNKTYTHTITSKTWDANGAKTLSNISWTLSNNGSYYGYDGTKGQQVGSKDNSAKSMTLTTSGFASASKIASVTINTSGASDIKANVSVKVGGTSYSCNSNTSPSITATATDYKFTGNSTGEVVISWSQTSSKAIYFKSIKVEYSNTTTTPGVTNYSDYVTNCCAIAPATNLTVSGTTSNTATLTWTTPSPTTGITKLQVRNADNDAVVVDNIAVGTTTATITGLTECTSYQYYVVSVGKDCEVVSNIVTAQPFGGAKTVNYNYNGGSGSVASFTTSCTNQTITLPTATRTGYDFNGWYNAATSGTRVGGAGDTYEPATSPVTLYAQWTKQIYSISFHANGGSGTMANQQADENDKIAKLNANQFTRDGYAFVGWNTKANGTGTAYADQATDITLTGNLTLYAQWAAIVTLNDAGTETTTHPATAGGTITLLDGENACDPYEFVGWTSVAIADWNEGIEEPALVASPYKPTQPTTLYAVYKIQSEGNSNAFKLSFEGSNGKTYYVGEADISSYLRGYSNITKEEAVTFIRTKMYPNDDTKYYLYLEYKEGYYYYNSSYGFSTTSSDPNETQGWVFHTVGDKIQIQAIGQERYLSYVEPGSSDTRTNITTHATGSQGSFNMLPVVTSTYVAAPLCEKKITITFETGNGDFVANAPATNPLTVTQGETITLPTCEYPGYEFMGWLKDEQQLDPSDILGTYYTGDYTVDGLSQSITFYAYYKVIPEEVEFTGKDDVELLMYYYDGTSNYYYASSLDGGNGELPSMQNCFNATTWTFTNVGNMQYHIQDEAGKYLGAVSDNDNDLSLSNTPKIWNFTLVNGLWKMVCEDSPSRALMYISTGKTFANAAISNEGNGAYSYVTLGICPYPTYTTNPVLTQGFVVTNTAMVTSAAGQKVKATSALTLETSKIELPCTFTITAPNITFYDNTGAEVTQLTASAASEQFELYFAYKPTAANTMEFPTITIVDDEMKTYTIKNRIQARSLPNTFAIVAKVGGMWYALPSQGLNSTDALVGYPIEVDNIADPTAVTAVPEDADWSLRQVYEASRVDATKDRFVANGENFVFVNNEGTPKALNASASGNYLLTDAQYSGYYETNPGLYEWTPTTTDLETYQLTNEQRSRTLSVNTTTVFGVHATDKAVEQVRFLPIQNRYIPAALQVVEWKENSIVIMYNGNPAQTASVSVNGGSAQETVLSSASAQRDIAVYELAAPGLAANPTQSLSITIGTEKAILPIPYIVSSETTDLALLPGTTVAARQDIAKVSDLVILKDATLTANGAKGNPYKFRNVTIYGGGKLVIPSEEKGFGVASLTLRAGGITDAGEYDYVYPQFDLRGTFTNSAAKINYDYITDYDHWFHLVLPFDGDLGTIKYPTEFYGANVKPNNTGSWQIKRYAGEIRATGNYDAWVDIETEGETSTIAGKGYIFWGAPKKVTVNGKTDRQKWGIQRITMSVTAPNAMTAENDDKAISELSSYANVPNNSGAANDQGWNLIGNPYMVNLTTMSEVGLKAGKLVEEKVDGNWTGKWINNGDNLRYLTIPSEHFDTYEAKTVSEAISANALVPGRAFFVQLEGEANGITFAAANRASLMPALLAENNDKPVDIETGIILSNETLQDEVNFWIKDGKTNDYEYNADYPKTPNNNHFNIYGVHINGDLSWVATGPEYAAESMPIGYQVPAAGTYTLSVSETYYSEDLQALYVTDHAMSPELTVDLMNAPYEFSVSQAETNNERFTVSVILKVEEDDNSGGGNSGDGNGDENGNGDDTTGVDNTTIHNRPYKFIYKNKIYILHNGVIYNAMGTQIQTINK